MKLAKKRGIKNILLFSAVGVLVCLVGLLVMLWAVSLMPSFRTERARKAAIAPLLKEARELNLTLDTALAAPMKSVGKPALWCLKQVTPGETLYGGEEGRKVYIDNPVKMGQPRSYRRDCDDTLVQIKDITAVALTGGPRTVRLTAEFIDYP